MPLTTRPVVVGAALFVCMMHIFGDIALAGAGERRVFDRVIAVVGREPILASELHARATPFLARVPAGASQAERAAMEQKLFRELLDKVIDERLEEREAERVHLTVAPDEIDRALASVAARNGMSVPRLLEEARTSAGLDERAYREEVRRQILEGKLLMSLPGARKLQVSDAEIDARLAELSKDGPKPSRDEVKESVLAEKMQRVRRDWVAGLRAEIYVEVRL